MPSIEITQAQIAALSRGESITIEPTNPKPEPGLYVLRFSDSDNVYAVSNPKHIEEGVYGNIYVAGDCVLVAKGRHNEPIGYLQTSVSGRGTVTKVA